MSKLTSIHAQELVSAALAAAGDMGIAASVAVVDHAGFLIAFGRSDDAPAYTVELAQGKAYAVVFMGRTSAEVSQLAVERPHFFDALKDLGLRTVIPSPGGLPLKPAGAIGVSGARDPNDDVRVAQAAISVVEAKSDLR